MLIEKRLAERTKRIRGSALREILKVISKPGMISLAGGLPAPASFPLDIIGELTSRVMEKYGARAFQYGTTEGFEPLRVVLAEHLTKQGIRAEADEVRITSGSQGLLDQIGKVLISRGDSVAVEAPTYLGALQAFNSYEPQYVCLDMDDQGVLPGSIERAIKKYDVKFIYLNPTFQNPTGRTLSLERRHRVAELLQKYDALLVEDDPYSSLRYRGESLPPLKTLAPDNVIYGSTFSKVLAPGFRVGFYVAPLAIRRWLVLGKQGVDLHTSTFTQAIATEYVLGGFLDRQIPKIIELYKPKQEAMLNALDKYFPAEFSWSRPDGGMFIWVVGPQGIDIEDVNRLTVEQKVAVVPGKFFYPYDNMGLETMRLNYTISDIPMIEKAIKIVANVIKEMLK